MDRRVKYTKNIIKECLIELLQSKDLNKITVSELCEKADINRATFYRYYIDIFDLLEKMEQELIDHLKEMLPDYQDYSMKDVIEEYLKVLLENKKLVKIIFSNRKSIVFLNDFFVFVYENCKEKWFLNVDIDENDKNLVSIFCFNGTLGVVNYWIQNDFEESVESISTLISRICYKGLYAYKKNK